MIPPDSNWFLEVNGKTTGPWTLEQLKDLYEQGHVQGRQKITHATQKALTSTVEEALSRVHPDHPIHLPPRPPSELTGPIPVEPSLLHREDPTLDLFDVIQSARDKAAQPKPAPSSSKRPDSGSDSFVPKGALVAAALLVIVGGTIWAFTRNTKETAAPLAKVAEKPAPLPVFKPVVPPPAAASRAVSTTTKPAPNTTTLKLNPPKFSFSATAQSLQHKKDLEAEREKEREREREKERERDEREREREERDRYRDRRDWRARDDRGDPIGATDRDPLAAPAEAGGTLAPAPNPAGPPKSDRPSDRSSDRSGDRYDDAQNPVR